MGRSRHGRRRSARWPRLSEAEAIEHCKLKLASYKKPKAVHFREALPRSSLGKILKSEVRESFWKDQERKI